MGGEVGEVVTNTGRGWVEELRMVIGAEVDEAKMLA